MPRIVAGVTGKSGKNAGEMQPATHGIAYVNTIKNNDMANPYGIFL
jgi:hypothetical protein